MEIVFSDPRRRRQIESPPPATDIARVTSLKILGVKMACRGLTMSVTSSDHARRTYTLYGSCARTACFTRRCRPSSASRHRQAALCIISDKTAKATVVVQL